MPDTVIYTCILGNYDELTDPVFTDPECDYVCFVGKGEKTSERKGIWQIRELDFRSKDFAVLSRYPKLNPHILLPEYSYSVWMDGNVSIAGDCFYEIIREKINAGILYSGIRHWARDCAYDEIKESLDSGIESRSRLLGALFFLKRHRFPKHFGMNENNVIFRRHNAPEIIRFDDLWWKLFIRYAHRDQILHPYCMRECGIAPDYLFPPPFCARNHRSLKYAEHNAGRKRYWHRHCLNKKVNNLIKKLI